MKTSPTLLLTALVLLGALLPLRQTLSARPPWIADETPPVYVLPFPPVEATTVPDAEQLADEFEAQANASDKYRLLFPERRDYYTGRSEAMRDAAKQLRDLVSGAR